MGASKRRGDMAYERVRYNAATNQVEIRYRTGERFRFGYSDLRNSQLARERKERERKLREKRERRRHRLKIAWTVCWLLAALVYAVSGLWPSSDSDAITEQRFDATKNPYE